MQFVYTKILSFSIPISVFCNTQQYTNTVFRETYLLQQLFFSNYATVIPNVCVFYHFPITDLYKLISLYLDVLIHAYGKKTVCQHCINIFSFNRSCAGHLFANHSVPSAWIIRSGSMLCSSQSSNPIYYVVEGQQAF